MTFDSNQIGMAAFLLVATGFSLWFVLTSCRRVFLTNATVNGNKRKPDRSSSYQLLSYAVLMMALFDMPWVWLCMIQCWNNTFHQNGFNQNSGDDSFGCKLMGWYSSFSLVSTMGSHCLVAYYLMNHLNECASSVPAPSTFLSSKSGLITLSTILLLAACLFAFMPLIQGDGYTLTSGGFCYADFTNKTQASTILLFTLSFLMLSSVLWAKIGRCREYWYYYMMFFCTWILWVPAASYGISSSMEISSPYMLLGAIFGHANAMFNPLLYGKALFNKLSSGEISNENGIDHAFKEAPEIA